MSVLPVLPLSKLPTLDMNPPPLDEVAGGLLELERFAKRPSPAGRGEGLSGYRNTQLRSEQTTRSRWATRSDTPFAQLYGYSARSLAALHQTYRPIVLRCLVVYQTLDHLFARTGRVDPGLVTRCLQLRKGHRIVLRPGLPPKLSAIELL